MDFIALSTLSENQKIQLMNIWNQEYPKNLIYNTIQEFESYLCKLVDVNHILLMDETESIKAWYFDFTRLDEKWFAMILSFDYQRRSIGSELLKLAKTRNSILNGWVIDHDYDEKQNGEFYKSPLEFYLKNGFEIISESRLESSQISAVRIKWIDQKKIG